MKIIVAVNSKDVIGANGGIPWKAPTDMKRFRSLTTNHTIVMGRKTFESIGRPLPKRRNIVISANPEYKHDGVEVFNTYEDAVNAAMQTDPDCFIIGGQSVYERALADPRCTKIELTEVGDDNDGDAFFKYDKKEWVLETEETPFQNHFALTNPPSPCNVEPTLVFKTLVKVKNL